MTLLCDYCGNPATFCPTSAHVYHGQDFGPVWHCAPCEAWVGCHKGDTKPLGTLANSQLRTMRRRVHEAFDRLWTDDRSRGKAYAWLAKQLYIKPEACHIGLFDIELCKSALVLCQ